MPPVKYPYNLTIISNGATLVLLVIVGHGGCCKIFGIWNKRLISNPLWKLIADFLGGSPPETFPFDLKSFLICTFLPHFWQFMSDLADEPPLDPLPFKLRRLLKSTCFKDFFIEFSMATVYEFGSEGWSWDFYLMVAGYHRFESTRLRYYRIAYCTRYL